MDQQIIERTNKKIAENYQAKQHTTVINGRSYSVHPNVFSPSIFLGTEWLTNNLICRLTGFPTFLQIGVGCGCTLIQALLSGKIKKATGCDINKQSVVNTLSNLQKYNLKADIYQSDVFDSLPKQKYGVVYWNFPFHPTEEQNQTLGPIEKGVRNYHYESLGKFMKEVKERLEGHGKVFIGFSEKMGDIQVFDKMAKDFGFTWKKQCQNQSGMICLLSLK